ncbi:MAG: TonB-dependent receptor [Alistipes sp.]|jgi:outer membrane receptor protein involved in Fe transport|nr:TonB-dependent receptor [Alistipes sp.]
MLKGRLTKTTLLLFLLSLATSALTSLPASADEPAPPDSAFAPKGTIKGRVIDAATGAPLLGTTILIEGTTLGTIADTEGGFSISNITPGRVIITTSYLGYEVFRQELIVAADQTVEVEIPLRSEGISMQDVVVTAQINNESENVQLSGQRDALVALQSVGAAEMSRKGMGDARAAVSQVSGISQQEGVKNVFVRGLGDRYNATFLNGFPLPSEDPEYKNIALEFFGSDIIRSIGVNKVFGAANGGDVGGATIDIHSKKLIGPRALSFELGGGANSEAVAADNFLRQDGVSYFGASRTSQPTAGRFDFANKLTPSTVSLPLNHSYGLSGGRRWNLSGNENPLSVFVVASHNSDYSFTDETVRNATTADVVYQDQHGQKSTIGISQLALANVDFNIHRRHFFSYNFMLIHANEQYVGEYYGRDPRYGDAYSDGNGSTETGWMRRQQSNDNLLLTHQLSTRLNLTDRLQLNLGVAYNTIKGIEPDRRENNLSLQADGLYITTGSNRQRRFFSELNETDLNLKASLSWRLKEGLDIEKSNVTLGYRGRTVDDTFEATEYSYGSFRSGGEHYPLDVDLDQLYNDANAFTESERGTPAGNFFLPAPIEDSYTVAKQIHSAYAEATHQFSERFAANVGIALDGVGMNVAHRTKERDIDTLYWLPSLSLRYNLTDKHSLRLGASKSYTLPQSKEISDYQYVNISFASQGNMNIRPSDNYNLDLKWDWYLSSSELLSLGAFYKYIANPIGRVDQGNSAGLLTYDNLGKGADVAGLELEMRKNIINTTTIRQNMRRLSLGLNASYIHSSLQLDVRNTPVRRSELEGASPLLINGDVSFNYSSGERALNVSVVAGWFSDRIHTLGTQGYNDIIEEGAMTLSLASSYRVNDHWTVKLRAGNLLDPAHRLTRGMTQSSGKIILGEYRKGVDVSVGVSFDLW